MSREIKFRVWDGDGFLNSDTYCLFPMDGYGNLLEVRKLMEYGRMETLADAVMVRYTGLKDKNGVEIYEGDILEWGMSHDQTNPLPRMKFVEFYEPQLIYKAVDVGDLPASVDYLYEARPDSTRWCKVVGNIYENPELLES